MEELTECGNTEVMSSSRDELFSSLLQQNQRSLYTYILSVTADKATADDIFQETGVTLLKKLGDFQEGTSFLAWAKATAFNKIREYRRKSARDRLVFDDDVALQLSEQSTKLEPVLNRRQSQLHNCVESLADHNRSIVTGFYEEKKTAQQLADSLGRSIFAIRKAIHKIRKKLFDCVDKSTGVLDE